MNNDHIEEIIQGRQVDHVGRNITIDLLCVASAALWGLVATLGGDKVLAGGSELLATTASLRALYNIRQYRKLK